MSLLLVRIGCVLARIHLLVVEVLDERVIAGGNQRAHDGAEPVDVVVTREIGLDDGWTQATCWVERCTSPAHTWDDKS